MPPDPSPAASGGTEQGEAPGALALRMLSLVRTRHHAAAAELACRTLSSAPDHPRLAQVSLLALQRGGNIEAAGQLATALADKADLTPELAGAAAAALLRQGRHDEAIAVARRGIAASRAAVPRLHLLEAQALVGKGAAPGEALATLDAVKDSAGEDLPLLRVYGELLLAGGRFAEAAAILGRAAILAPDLANVQRLYARALTHAGRLAEAGEVGLRALRLDPSGHARRTATAALLAAGREAEAVALFEIFVQERGSRLAPSFQAQLDRLQAGTGTADIPPSRLDWAWQVAGRALGHPPAQDRAAWEQRGRWGHLADLAIIDWLECRPERGEEVSALFADLELARAAIRRVLAAGRGVVLASAHVGPMFAGPLALHLMGIPHRWVASTPRVSTTAYAGALISTSSLSAAQVARQIVQALRGGEAVTLACDGAMSPDAPRARWEGRSVTYSDFAATLAFRLGVPALFVASFWDGERIGFTVEALPEVDRGETLAAFTDRWREAYFGQVLAQFRRGPESLRLSGGLWRGA